MRNLALLTITLLSYLLHARSQTKDSVGVVISHIFFCVDSVTYQNLFHHDFIVKEFANTRESTVKTLTDSWTGKYLNGRRAYIEVFSSNDTKKNPQIGDKFGDLAIVFRTKKPGEAARIDSLMKRNKMDTQLELMKYELEGKIIPFNYNLYLSNSPMQETFRPYVEEFTVDFLKLSGFSENEIASGISEEQFREKRRGKKYEKLFDNIEKIELALTKDELDYLSETLKYLGFTRTAYSFSNKALEIVCSLEENRKYKLKTIHFTLLNQAKSMNIAISKHLTFTTRGTKGSFQFNY